MNYLLEVGSPDKRTSSLFINQFINRFLGAPRAFWGPEAKIRLGPLTRPLPPPYTHTHTHTHAGVAVFPMFCFPGKLLNYSNVFFSLLALRGPLKLGVRGKLLLLTPPPPTLGSPDFVFETYERAYC